MGNQWYPYVAPVCPLCTTSVPPAHHYVFLMYLYAQLHPSMHYLCTLYVPLFTPYVPLCTLTCPLYIPTHPLHLLMYPLCTMAGF